MARRITSGKAALEPVVIGDLDLGAKLVEALAATEPISRVTHGFHTYPAGLHADAARILVNALPGDSVLDPFCGGGTVLVEAMLAGRRAVGRDISPIALRVAKARTSVLSADVVSRFRAAGRKIADSAKISQEPPTDRVTAAVQEWYSRHVMWELAELRRGYENADPDIRPLLEVVFSSILIKASYRKSDTSAQRQKYDRPKGTTAILFHKKVRELGRMLDELREAVPAGTPPADIAEMDARQVRVLPQVDLVVTSPPYPSTYDYVPMQHLRLIWLGEGRALVEGAAEIGSRRAWREGGKMARRHWAEDTMAWTAAAASCLKPGGHMAIAIGDGLSPAGGIDASEPTSTAGIAAGLTLVARASVERPDFAREQNRWEHVFVFRKPEARP